MSEQGSEGKAPVITFTRRHAIIGGVLCAASAVGYARQPVIANASLNNDTFNALVPRSFGQWADTGSGDVVLPPPDALRDRLYDNLVTRTYFSAEQGYVMLLLAYNNVQDGVLQVHRPEVCYPAGGYNLSETQPMLLAAHGMEIPSNRFVASSPKRVENVLYFTRQGDAFPRSWLEQRLSVMKANLKGVIPDGMMMRVSQLSGDTERSFGALEDFSNQFINASGRELRRLLIGMNAA